MYAFGVVLAYAKNWPTLESGIWLPHQKSKESKGATCKYMRTSSGPISLSPWSHSTCSLWTCRPLTHVGERPRETHGASQSPRSTAASAHCQTKALPFGLVTVEITRRVFGTTFEPAEAAVAVTARWTNEPVGRLSHPACDVPWSSFPKALSMSRPHALA